ncbi:hypothetical protein BPO_p0065 (plasmid) [Bergeyella porcorum]|uniref:Uncharacterized protein n=1 Tax=Bergeyella porcorum TaxID=1735111 RepID=A0AAU0F4Z8_9FLAO
MSGQATRSYNTYFINKDTGNVTIEQNVCKIATPIGGKPIMG